MAYTHFRPHERIYGRNFLLANFNSKKLEFSKTLFTVRFLRLWRMILTGEQINFRKCFTIPYTRDYKMKLTRWRQKLVQSSSKYHFVDQSRKIILTLLYTASEESSVSITMITIPIIPNIRA